MADAVTRGAQTRCGQGSRAGRGRGRGRGQLNHERGAGRSTRSQTNAGPTNHDGPIPSASRPVRNFPQSSFTPKSETSKGRATNFPEEFMENNAERDGDEPDLNDESTMASINDDETLAMINPKYGPLKTRVLRALEKIPDGDFERMQQQLRDLGGNRYKSFRYIETVGNMLQLAFQA